jgi:hypothetical protein
VGLNAVLPVVVPVVVGATRVPEVADEPDIVVTVAVSVRVVWTGVALTTVDTAVPPPERSAVLEAPLELTVVEVTGADTGAVAANCEDWESVVEGDGAVDDTTRVDMDALAVDCSEVEVGESVFTRVFTDPEGAVDTTRVVTGALAVVCSEVEVGESVFTRVFTDPEGAVDTTRVVTGALAVDCSEVEVGGSAFTRVFTDPEGVVETTRVVTGALAVDCTEVGESVSTRVLSDADGGVAVVATGAFTLDCTEPPVVVPVLTDPEIAVVTRGVGTGTLTLDCTDVSDARCVVVLSKVDA